MRFSAMRDQYMRTGEGFLIVFALNDKHTFDTVSTFYEQVSHFAPLGFFLTFNMIHLLLADSVRRK